MFHPDLFPEQKTTKKEIQLYLQLIEQSIRGSLAA